MSDTKIISNLGDDNISLMIDLLTDKSAKLLNELEKAKLSVVVKQKEYDTCISAISTLQMSAELKSNLKMNEGYSKGWSWPTKTLFILKQIKRPLTAKEVIRSIEIYEDQKIPEDKKTSVFTALSNLTKCQKILREKPGAEYVYSMVDKETAVVDSFSKALENIKENLSKEKM